MRGNRALELPRLPRLRSIPAHAGEPRRRSRWRRTRRVYPRACGGTRSAIYAVVKLTGLSPRMRGNHHRLRPRDRHCGSIPAHAGEPHARMRPRCSSWVYPRACGGTYASAGRPLDAVGLSPRMRGNRDRRGEPRCPTRSIPAHAGEPRPRLPRRGKARVYPRACGGTGTMLTCHGPHEGLSPRMRGNHRGAERGVREHGSIPAHAGEPRCRGAPSRRDGVYPRACGGTADTHPYLVSKGGLSPRMRGNPGDVHDAALGLRSIPAHAGEPA